MIGAMARRISSPIIVGRTEELEQLRAAAARGAAGADTATVVVSGEAGVGKSRLVAELAASGVELGVRPRGRGLPGARRHARCRTRRSWRRSRRCSGTRDDRQAATPARWHRPRPRPPRARPGRRGSPTRAPSTCRRRMIPGRVFDAVRTLLQRAARERPLVVVFEDLHWADPASLDLIGYLVRSGGWPGAIVVTYRSDELHRRHPLAAVDRRDRRASRRSSGSSSSASGRRTSRPRPPPSSARRPSAALTDELVRRGGGNAFLTEELLASRSADGRIPRATGRHAGAPRARRRAPRRRPSGRRGAVGRRVPPPTRRPWPRGPRRAGARGRGRDPAGSRGAGAVAGR